MSEPAVAALEYASPRIEKPSKSVYRLVMVLGGAPMVVGGLLLLLFWGLRWGWRADAPILMIALSALVVMGGLAALLVFINRERRFKRLTPWEFQFRVVAAAVLLALNLPVVGFYVRAAEKMTWRTTVTVVNTSARTIDRFVVDQSGVKTDLGPVAPGATVKGVFNVSLRDRFGYEAWQTTRNSSSMAGGSLSNARDSTITISGTGMTISSK